MAKDLICVQCLEVYIRRSMKGNNNCALKYKIRVFRKRSTTAAFLCRPSKRPNCDSFPSPTTGFKKPVRITGTTRLRSDSTQDLRTYRYTIMGVTKQIIAHTFGLTVASECF